MPGPSNLPNARASSKPARLHTADCHLRGEVKAGGGTGDQVDEGTYRTRNARARGMLVKIWETMGPPAAPPLYTLQSENGALLRKRAPILRPILADDRPIDQIAPQMGGL